MLAKDEAFIKFCTQSATGTSNSHKRINPELMMNYQFAGHPETIKKYGGSLNQMLEMCAKNEIQNTSLKKLREWLHPLVVNSELAFS